MEFVKSMYGSDEVAIELVTATPNQPAKAQKLNENKDNINF